MLGWMHQESIWPEPSEATMVPTLWSGRIVTEAMSKPSPAAIRDSI